MNLAIYENRWCAVQVRPRYETLVSTILRTKGYEEFVPVYIQKRQWTDRCKEIELPLFPTYVFCRFVSKIWGSIVTTPGVIRILGSANQISVIDDEEIESIKRVLQAGMKVEPVAHATIGERVRITSGPLAGVEGTVTGYKNRCRLILSIELIQSSVALEIDGHRLERVVPPRPSEEPCIPMQNAQRIMRAPTPLLSSVSRPPT